MAQTTTTTADSAIPELWSAITADAREENLIVFNMFDRRYEEEAKGKPYDTIHVQGVNNFSTGALSSAPGAVTSLTYEAMAFATQINISIDTHAYHAYDVQSDAELLTNINLMEKAASKSSYAIALKMDDDAAGMIDDFGTSPVGSLASPLDLDDVNTAMLNLNKAIVPTSDRFFLMSPDQHAHFLSVERLLNSLYSGSVGNVNTKNQTRGYFFSGYGAEWYWSGNTEGTSAAGHDNGMFQREAVAVAVVDNMRTHLFYDIDTDSTKHAIHVVYGLKEIRDNHGVWMKGL